jgi:UDP-N-acetylglucosamine 2-epimerase
VLFNRNLAKQRSAILKKLQLEPGTFGLVTVHRASNTDEKGRLGKLLQTFNEVAAKQLPLVFPVHPRTANALKSEYAGWTAHPNLHLVDPLGYLDMLSLLDNAKIALTDSGGLQKEAFFLGCPCITLREETEWVETVEAGGNRLTGTDPEKILAAVTHWQQYSASGVLRFSSEAAQYFGDGHAASAILDTLLQFSGRRAA